VASLPRVAGIKRRWWQYWRASASEFAAARRLFGLGSGEEWRGDRGLLIGAAREGFNGLHQREFKEGRKSLHVVTSVIISRRWKKILTRGAHLSAGEKEKRKIPIRIFKRTAVSFLYWAKGLPEASSSSFFVPFYFLFSNSFYTFLQNGFNSKQTNS
jgi:hypothetical protein